MKLASRSERPNLPWTFRVVDDPAVNAFALPGGFIYVTRGILTYLESEAELAGVMGHEIGHVTAKHSVNQMATQQLTQIGLIGAMIVKPELQKYTGLASAGLQLLFLKFNRDDESQADALGVRYMNRIGDDPHQMETVMTMLDGVTQASGGSGTPEWLQTHPNPGNRKEHIAQIIDTMRSAPIGTTVNEDAYLRRLDGIVFGQNPRDGFFRGTTFYQPDLKFRFDFPQGWKTQNQKNSVVAASPNQDAVIQITLAKDETPEAAATTFFSQQGVTAQRTNIGNVHGFPTSAGTFTAQSQQGSVAGIAAFVEYGANVYQILGYTGDASLGQYQPTFQQAIGSFDKLTDPAMLNVKPQLVKIVTLDRNMSLSEFNTRYPSGISLDELALINQVDKGAQLRSGRLVKRVVGEKFQ
jgi:predicted Zn-dependent protease